MGPSFAFHSDKCGAYSNLVFPKPAKPEANKIKNNGTRIKSDLSV
jgi:hypothetical protein